MGMGNGFANAGNSLSRQPHLHSLTHDLIRRKVKELHSTSSGQVRSGQVRSGQVRSGQVRSGQVRSGQVRSGQVRSPYLADQFLSDSSLTCLYDFDRRLWRKEYQIFISDSHDLRLRCVKLHDAP